MKYTNYIIKGKFIDTQTLEAMPKILLPVTITVAFIALAFCAGMIPVAITFDSYRNVRCATIKFERKHHYQQQFVESKPVQFVLIKNPIAQEVQSILRRVA